jgi:hypothetical protein
LFSTTSLSPFCLTAGPTVVNPIVTVAVQTATAAALTLTAQANAPLTQTATALTATAAAATATAQAPTATQTPTTTATRTNTPVATGTPTLIGVSNITAVPASQFQCVPAAQGQITASLFTARTFTVSAMLTTGAVPPGVSLSPTITIVTVQATQTFPCSATGPGQPGPLGQLTFNTQCNGTITGANNAIVPGSFFTVTFRSDLVARGQVPNVLSLAPLDGADALAALPTDRAMPLGSLAVGADAAPLPDLAMLAAARSASPLAASLVHAGFDAVRRSAADLPSPVASAAAPVALGRRVSLLGDVPIAALAEPGPHLADRMGALGRVEAAAYGRDGPVIGDLRRDFTAPFRL